jgi:hypothetical protein
MGSDYKGYADPPDFYGAAEKTSQGSRPNTQGPLGGQTWSTGPDGRPQSQFAFTPEAQGIFSGLLGNMGKAAGYDPTQARDQAITSNYDQAKSRLDPMWAQKNEGFRSQMANSGLDPGMQAYDSAQGNQSRAENDAYQTAMAGAIGQGNQTQAAQMAQMNQPFNQMGSLLTGGMQTPNLGQGPNYNAAAQQQYGADSDKAEAKSDKKGSTLGGVGKIAGVALGGRGGGGGAVPGV